MARDILSEYGRDTPKVQRGVASSGGVTQAKDIANYKTPQGPTSIGNPKSPGLHGTNHGTGQCHYPTKDGGSVGLHGTIKPKGSQR